MPGSAICGQINVAIVKRWGIGEVVALPKQWIVERTIG